MNENIERALFHGIGVVDYFKNNSTKDLIEAKCYLDEIENTLDLNDEEKDYIVKNIKEETNQFNKIEVFTKPNKSQLDYLNTISIKKLDEPFVNEMNRIRKKSCKLTQISDIADVNDVLFKLSSFAFCHMVDNRHDVFETVRITEDVFYYLNLINELFPSVKEEVNKVKELFYPLYYSYIVKNYFDADDENYDLISLVMDFNKEDVNRLFGLNDRLYPTSFIEDFLDQLDSDEKMELNSGLTTDGEHKFFGDSKGDGQGYYLQFVLMHNSGNFRDNYDSLYKKFMLCDISNMHVHKALVSQYNNKKSQGKRLLKYVVEEKLTEENIKLYNELKCVFDEPNRDKFKSKDLASKIASLLLLDENQILPTLLTEADNSLIPFCMKHMICDILEDVRFNANDIAFLLKYSPNTIKAYLLKPSKYIFKKDISELYIMSVYLLNLNMLVESRMVINKLLEMLRTTEDLFNKSELCVIENQLKLVELMLGYKK